MNEEYLWNKTGEDAEIEKLENALQKFRYQEKSAPRVFVNNTKEKRFKFSLVRFLVPAMACFALVALGLGLSKFVFKDNESTEISAVSEKTPAEIRETHSAPDYSPNLKKENRNISETVLRKKETVRAEKTLYKSVKTNRDFKNKNVRRLNHEKLKINNSNLATILTEEEKYAYEQLMTALAITGSKLKQVQDKIYGAEN